MPQDSLSFAKKLMKRRKFSKAVLLLESHEQNYENNFDFYLKLGISYLYLGDYGSASSNFQKARRIKMSDISLLLGQAVLYLRRGDTERAIQYYMEILEYDPQNKVALDAMEFIRKDGDYSTICSWVDSGKIEKFFPPVGIAPYKILKIAVPVIAACLGGIFAFSLSFQEQPISDGRADLSYLELTAIDKKDIIDKNSSSSYKVVLSSSQIEKTFDKIFTYYNDGRDNACQIEINRILNSNASFAVKQKARNIMDYLEIPDFTTLKDVPTFSQVNENPFLYLDCWINWKGRISNAVQGENSFDCDFLVGYEDLKKVDGVVPLRFAESPEILIDQPLEVLAKISDDLGKIYLEGRAVHQNAKNLVNP